MKRFLALSLFFVSTLSFAVSIPSGKKAADFKLQAADGSQYALSQFKGKTVVLEWFNHECPYVKKHYNAKNMQKLQEEAKSQDIVWLSVISSAPNKQGYLTKESAKEALQEWKPQHTALLFDPSGKVGKAYDAQTTPHMYIIDKNGVLAYQGAIDDKPSTQLASVNEAEPLFAKALKVVSSGKSLPKKMASNDPYGCSVKY